ncbi:MULTISPECIES: OmpA family protein [unclassified Anaerobiospirillum]|uniref:OmpA family protein n=1 Tax=unclassified Anaerobiospirillum TaxID=2647410 RepID=UPI001FF510EE|nr:MULTISPECIES: OmpA family protein [unclassified Anaerobiospirillum]MCK0535383.1 OmpA family protein [Anaerobiospirillum sp. NML120511]MCK0539075.1 OmpA family protein [Anaerobiospirillum sp. NML02-A-032]
MKKNLLALSVASALLATASVSVAAVSDTGYFGGRLGYAFSEWNGNDADLWHSTDKKGIGGGIYGGYSLSSWFSLEGAYNYLGGFKAEDNAGESKSISLHGPELSARFSLPLNDNGADLFLRGGVMYALATDDGNGFVPVAGMGVSFMPADSLSVRVGYDRYFDAYDSDEKTQGIDFDVNYMYAGLSFVFGGKSDTPVAEPVSQTVTTTYTLDANTTFGFDSAVVSQEGQDAINQVILETQNSNLQFVQYNVTGYSDRIGNPDYNQKLSERRAAAVAEVLVAKGVAQSDISASGLGSTAPVSTGCDDKMARKDLIKCLAADRRVEINVTGTAAKTEEVKK